MNHVVRTPASRKIARISAVPFAVAPQSKVTAISRRSRLPRSISAAAAPLGAVARSWAGGGAAAVAGPWVDRVFSGVDVANGAPGGVASTVEDCGTIAVADGAGGRGS